MAQKSENVGQLSPQGGSDATTTPKADAHEESGKKSSEGRQKDALEDCEFAVAADLTLYANPLRCLKKTAKPPLQHAASGADMIAADLVKYGSPLDK